MKVVCINDKWGTNDSVPKENEIVTVVGECRIYKNSYDILEYPCDSNGTPQSLRKSHFIPLDEYLAIEEQIQECLTRELIEVL
jgi:hypothetical protein